MMEKFWRYLHGLYLALIGKFPHRELEHLDFIQSHIRQDARWLSIHPSVSMLSNRHEQICHPDTWRQYSVQDISRFRDDLFEQVRRYPGVDHNVSVFPAPSQKS